MFSIRTPVLALDSALAAVVARRLCRWPPAVEAAAAPEISCREVRETDAAADATAVAEERAEKQRGASEDGMNERAGERAACPLFSRCDRSKSPASRA